MPRVVFAKGEQKRYLTTVKKAVNTRVEILALNCGVHPRTIRDWQREEYLIRHQAITSLEKFPEKPCPTGIEIFPE